jgi:peptidoglycan-associated lipoprotein
MKINSLIQLVALMGTALFFQGCTRTGTDVWEDTKSAGRHLNRSVCALAGDAGTSRQIRCREDFECIDDENSYPQGNFQDCDYQQQMETDFIPLQDQANSSQQMSRQPRETPGEPGSSIPSIEAFRDPSTIPELAPIFQNIYFDYDSSLIKGQKNLQILHNIADYMRRHPNVYVFVEGHTDERGPQAYNFALGSRRSNSIRNILLSEGVNPDTIFTVSYGKDRPLVIESHEEGWSKNRRAEFKVYVR